MGKLICGKSLVQSNLPPTYIFAGMSSLNCTRFLADDRPPDTVTIQSWDSWPPYPSQSSLCRCNSNLAQLSVSHFILLDYSKAFVVISVSWIISFGYCDIQGRIAEREGNGAMPCPRLGSEKFTGLHELQTKSLALI